MNINYLRREFLKKVSVFAGTMVLSPFLVRSLEVIDQTISEPHDEIPTPRINPAFRFQHLNDGSLELYTFRKPGSKLIYHFSGLEAAVLLLIGENKLPDANIIELADKYSLSYSECKTEILSAMDEFKKKGLIYYGEMMIARKTEEIYE
jgi:hypothetical protein